MLNQGFPHGVFNYESMHRFARKISRLQTKNEDNEYQIKEGAISRENSAIAQGNDDCPYPILESCIQSLQEEGNRRTEKKGDFNEKEGVAFLTFATGRDVTRWTGRSPQ